jgi:Arc/MetJ-type ribon-helix-helix transcriptional regulator
MAISVRLDDESARDLADLEASGLSRSDAVRAGLRAAAARLREPRALAAEARALAGDEADRAEAAAVRELMEDLRAPW